ncbi:unnamed protein product [Rhodiola kirilowii]
MSNFVKLDFAPLLVTGSNYVPWSVDIKNHLRSKSLIETLDDKDNSSESDKATALIFIRRHIDESLKNEHLTVENPSELWMSLKDRYDHQRDVILPKYRDAWNTLRFQDFKRVSDYNSTMFSIVSYLKYCGITITDKEMIEKTLSTFHASGITLQQQYRLQGFQEYSKLITNLLVAEEQNELLIKNHQSRPTGSKPFTEANFVRTNKLEPVNNFQGRGRGRGRGHGQGRGRGSYYDNSPKTVNHHHKRNRDEWNQENYNKWEMSSNSANNQGSSCHRCGMKGHWYKTCRTPDYFVKLYQESRSRKEKGKGKEVNLIENPLNEFAHFGAPDFHNDIGDTDGDYTSAKGTNYVDQDPIKEYTHLGESDFYHGHTRDSNEQGDGGN